VEDVTGTTSVTGTRNEYWCQVMW